MRTDDLITSAEVLNTFMKNIIYKNLSGILYKVSSVGVFNNTIVISFYSISNPNKIIMMLLEEFEKEVNGVELYTPVTNLSNGCCGK